MQELSVMETFINNLKAAIDAAGIRQKDLCERTGIRQPNLSRILTKADNITLAIASDLASAAGYPLYKLLDPSFQPKRTARKHVAA